MHINNIIANEFGEPNSHFELVLHLRTFILNPDYFVAKYPDVFGEIILHPGEVLVSDHSHSVVGFCGLSVAWNVLLLDDIVECSALEKEMADCMRTNTPSLVRYLRNTDGRGPIIHFSIANELLTSIDRRFHAMQDTSYLGRRSNRVNKVLVDRLRKDLFQPALHHINNLYIRSYKQPPCMYGMTVAGVDGKLESLVCHVCGIPCLVEAVVVTVPKSSGSKKATTVCLLCPECYATCVYADCIKEAHLLGTRPSRDIFSSVYVT